MALTIVEQFNSRNVVAQYRDFVGEMTLEQIFHIYGSDDPTDPAVLALGPQLSDPYVIGSGNPLGLYVVNQRWEVLKIADPNQAGVIRLTVTYGPPQRLPAPPGTSEISIDVATQSLHLEAAPLGQTNYPSTAVTPGNAINVNNGAVGGVDIMVPKVSFSMTQESGNLPSGLLTTIRDLVGTVNGSSFQGYDAGEVLMVGAKVNRKGHGSYHIEYQFSVSPNTTQSISTTAGTQSVSVGGWEYLWLEREELISSGERVVAVAAAHVATVYPSGDFDSLGL